MSLCCTQTRDRKLMPNEGLLQKYIHQTINVNKQIKSNTYIEYIKYLHGQIAEIKTIHHIHALRSKSHKHFILTTKRGFVRVPVCAQPWFRAFQPASNWI